MPERKTCWDKSKHNNVFEFHLHFYLMANVVLVALCSKKVWEDYKIHVTVHLLSEES